MVDGNIVKPVTTKMQFKTERKVPKVSVDLVLPGSLSQLMFVERRILS